jgi:hypothetical protein
MNAQDHASFDASTLEHSADTPAAARAVIPPGMDDAAIRFVTLENGEAMAWRPYRLHIGARLVLGRTDENGFTAQLSGAERAALTDWEVE